MFMNVTEIPAFYVVSELNYTAMTNINLEN